MTNNKFYKKIASLSEFKTIHDEFGNEYVLFKNSCMDSIHGITDKTEFEAVENHVHLLDNINANEFEKLTKIAPDICGLLLNSLQCTFPDKHFAVYVTVHLHDSMIIRFHQKWENEDYYFDPEFSTSAEKTFMMDC